METQRKADILVGAVSFRRTQEVVGGQPFKVPHLQHQDGGKLLLSFIQRKDALSLRLHHYLRKRRVERRQSNTESL